MRKLVGTEKTTHLMIMLIYGCWIDIRSIGKVRKLLVSTLNSVQSKWDSSFTITKKNMQLYSPMKRGSDDEIHGV